MSSTWGLRTPEIRTRACALSASLRPQMVTANKLLGKKGCLQAKNTSTIRRQVSVRKKLHTVLSLPLGLVQHHMAGSSIPFGKGPLMHRGFVSFYRRIVLQPFQTRIGSKEGSLWRLRERYPEQVESYDSPIWFNL